MLDGENHPSLAALQHLEDDVLTGSGSVVAVDGKNLVSGFDAAIEVGHLVLHHILDVDPGLVWGFLNEQTQSTVWRLQQLNLFDVRGRGF